MRTNHDTRELSLAEVETLSGGKGTGTSKAKAAPPTGRTTPARSMFTFPMATRCSSARTGLLPGSAASGSSKRLRPAFPRPGLASVGDAVRWQMIFCRHVLH